MARRREAIRAITTGDRSRLLCKTPHDHVGSSQDANRLQRGAEVSLAVIRKLVDAKDFRLSAQCVSYYLPRTPIGCNAGLGFRSPLFGNYWRGMTYGRQCNACPSIDGYRPERPGYRARFALAEGQHLLHGTPRFSSPVFNERLCHSQTVLRAPLIFQSTTFSSKTSSSSHRAKPTQHLLNASASRWDDGSV